MGMTEAGTDEIPCFFPASRENPAGPGILRVTSWATFIAVQQVLGQLGQTGPTRNALHLGLDTRRELLRNVACRSVAGPVGGDQHDPVGLYPRSGPEPRRDFELL